MKELKLIEKRKSYREYKNKKLTPNDKEMVDIVLNTVREMRKDASLEIVYMEDGDDAFSKLDGHAGYKGKMIKAPQYLMLLSDNTEKCHKLSGYMGEHVILSMLRHDIVSCWIDVEDSDDVKKVLGMDTEKEVVAFISFGYPKFEFKFASIFKSMSKDSLSSLTDIGYPNIDVTKDKEVDYTMPVSDFVYLSRWGKSATPEELMSRGIEEVFHYV